MRRKPSSFLLKISPNVKENPGLITVNLFFLIKSMLVID